MPSDIELQTQTQSPLPTASSSAWKGDSPAESTEKPALPQSITQTNPIYDGLGTAIVDVGRYVLLAAILAILSCHPVLIPLIVRPQNWGTANTELESQHLWYHQLCSNLLVTGIPWAMLTGVFGWKNVHSIWQLTVANGVALLSVLTVQVLRQFGLLTQAPALIVSYVCFVGLGFLNGYFYGRKLKRTDDDGGGRTIGAFMWPFAGQFLLVHPPPIPPLTHGQIGGSLAAYDYVVLQFYVAADPFYRSIIRIFIHPVYFMLVVSLARLAIVSLEAPRSTRCIMVVMLSAANMMMGRFVLVRGVCLTGDRVLATSVGTLEGVVVSVAAVSVTKIFWRSLLIWRDRVLSGLFFKLRKRKGGSRGSLYRVPTGVETDEMQDERVSYHAGALILEIIVDFGGSFAFFPYFAIVSGSPDLVPIIVVQVVGDLISSTISLWIGRRVLHLPLDLRDAFKGKSFWSIAIPVCYIFTTALAFYTNRAYEMWNGRTIIGQ